jgi:hypothetical protein
VEASAVVVAMPPVNVMVTPMTVVPLVGVVPAMPDVVVLMHALVGMVAAVLHLVVFVHPRVVVMLASGDMVMFVHARVMVVTALGNVVMHMRTGARAMVAHVVMTDDRTGHMLMTRRPNRPNPADLRNARRLVDPCDSGNPSRDKAPGHRLKDTTYTLTVKLGVVPPTVNRSLPCCQTGPDATALHVTPVVVMLPEVRAAVPL